MSDNDVFVKRVDFEEDNNNNNNNIPAVPLTTISNGDGKSDVEKLAEADKKATCTSKFCNIIDKCGIKSALSHIGLLLSLGLFCYGGGWVMI